MYYNTIRIKIKLMLWEIGFGGHAVNVGGGMWIKEGTVALTSNFWPYFFSSSLAYTQSNNACNGRLSTAYHRISKTNCVYHPLEKCWYLLQDSVTLYIYIDCRLLLDSKSHISTTRFISILRRGISLQKWWSANKFLF